MKLKLMHVDNGSGFGKHSASEPKVYKAIVAKLLITTYVLTI